jgi:hypothetical protein
MYGQEFRNGPMEVFTPSIHCQYTIRTFSSRRTLRTLFSHSPLIILTILSLFRYTVSTLSPYCPHTIGGACVCVATASGQARRFRRPLLTRGPVRAHPITHLTVYTIISIIISKSVTACFRAGRLTQTRVASGEHLVELDTAGCGALPTTGATLN